MQQLLGLSRAIDRLNGHIGRGVAWLIVVAAVISAANAVVRKLLHYQLERFTRSPVVAVRRRVPSRCALDLELERAHPHRRREQLSPRRQRNAIEMIGHIFFLLPAAVMIVVTSWHYFLTSLAQNEQSQNAGGLPQWPIKALIPVAFTLLFIQGVSELIKRVAIIRGDLPEPTAHDGYHDIAVAAGSDIPPDDERDGGKR